MSQVRKLQKEKVQKNLRGHVIIGSRDYDMNDDAIRIAFEDYLGRKGNEYGEYLSGVMDLINSGEDYYGDKIGNYSNYGGPDSKTAKKLSKKRSEAQMQLDALMNNSVQRAKNAIHYINQFNYEVPIEEVKVAELPKISSENIKLDFNTDNGKYYLSQNAGENISARNRINKIFEHIKSGENSKYDASDYDIDTISKWIDDREGDDKYLAANNYLEDLWNRMSTLGYQKNQDDEDFLRNFRITYDLQNLADRLSEKTDTVTKPTTSITPNAALTEEVVGDNIEDTVPEIKGDRFEIEVPSDNEEKKTLVQVLPLPTEKQEKVRIHVKPWFTSGVRNYTEKIDEVEGEHIGNFSTDGMAYKIYKRPDGTYYFVSGIGENLYDLIGKNKITEEDVNNILNGNIPKDLRKNLHNMKDTELFRKSIPNFLRTIQLMTPAGRAIANATFLPSEDDNKFYVPYKEGGIIKGQSGLKTPLYKMYDPTKPYNQQYYAWHNPEGLGKDYTIFSNNTNTLNTVSTNTIGSTTNNKFGGYGRDVPSLYRYADSLLGIIQFAGVAGYQNKQRDLSKKAVEAARYQLEPTVYNQYRTDSPALQQQRNELINQQMQNVPAVSSDAKQYYLSKLMRDAQLRQALNENTKQQSDYESRLMQQNVAIQNQNIANAIQTANQNRQINATINSALYNPDIQLNAERKQSFENKMLEIRNKINRQTDILNRLQVNRLTDKYNKEYDSALDQLNGIAALRKEWNKLGTIGQSEYTDFEDYLYKYDNGVSWKKNNWGTDIDRLKNTRDDAIQAATAGIMVNPYLLRLLGTFNEANYHPNYYQFKKGGRLRGTTRYTLEPDERIWIDNNKAVHQLVSKLSDNTIKLLLRALK